MKNIDKWSAKRFTRDNKGRIIGTYNHKIIGNAYEPIIRKYAKGRLLDLGCGDVPYYLFYKGNVSENVCVDWENCSLEDSFLDIVADLNKPIPSLDSNSFDTVLCTDVLEHIYDPNQMFDEMARVLKTNGHLILAVPFMYWIHETPHDYHRYTKFMLTKFCESRGLQIILMKEYGGLPEILFDLTYKGIKFNNLRFTALLLKLLLVAGTIMSKISVVKRISNRTRSSFPLGYILVAKKR